MATHSRPDCLISVTYQASMPGLLARGLSEGQASALMKSAVALARDARDEFYEREVDRAGPRPRPIVAAGIGPYGAYLADGSEYREVNRS